MCVKILKLGIPSTRYGNMETDEGTLAKNV